MAALKMFCPEKGSYVGGVKKEYNTFAELKFLKLYFCIYYLFYMNVTKITILFKECFEQFTF